MQEGRTRSVRENRKRENITDGITGRKLDREGRKIRGRENRSDSQGEHSREMKREPVS